MKFRRYLPAVIWFLFIAFVSLRSGNKMPHIGIIPHFDKFAHFGVYAIFSCFLVPVFPVRSNLKMALILSLLVSIALGVGFEYLQLLSTKRSKEYTDMIANSLGAITGLFAYLLMVRKKKLEQIIFKIE